MAHPVAITIIIIVILIAVLVITGYISDPIIDIPSLALLGFLTYRVINVVIKTRGRNLYSYEGKIGKALEDMKVGKEGYVLVEGEYWQAIALEDIKKGEDIVVVKREGLKLIVKKRASRVETDRV
ncbi:serine protease [Sulfolobus sp. E1]|uniref:NfeD family protein n=1 Tax=Saccharolobus sp. A20 TaxID=1891280 RepID=UPI000846274A|nr:NfeD family protein [Sulfolobus sp. A20]TRM73923.1 serine protease [Sulfolobus sp. A20-N-F8]TRM76057.1 serine protease [Sulfolobus sp. E5]TRM78038.1 serine protease [Sulfolobus sp. B5]TRM81087.1 serine protease [Sulfolobus sp. D5]TRM87411.1 serine protease [Sulfolobus sp. C3]TRM93696.1 serine protease [Sulfolobus sp. A20-N-G8]TRM97680.1 serine protease [Sulfolobus sp. F1]TRN00894.1 serine protease [Sulfolobus sp. E1]